MHRNTFVDAPRALDATFALRTDRRVRFAGQITGTEGYTEAIATGLLAAVNTWADLTDGTVSPSPRRPRWGRSSPTRPRPRRSTTSRCT